MILIFAFLLGAALGAYRAKRRGGNRLDIVQYAAVHGIALALLVLFGLIFAERNLADFLDTTPPAN